MKPQDRPEHRKQCPCCSYWIEKIEKIAQLVAEPYSVDLEEPNAKEGERNEGKEVTTEPDELRTLWPPP